jgi:hypothetical protein
MSEQEPSASELTQQDQRDVAALREAQAFKPNARPMLIAVGLNVLLAALCLGLPYYRGKATAREALAASSRAFACLLNATPRTDLGLSLPPAERSHFAHQVLHAEKSWPGSCQPAFAAVVPEDAIFLWPSVKTAIGDVRATGKLVDGELTALASDRQQGITRVPERPLLALGKLRAALTLLARAAGVSDTLDAPAVSFDKSPLVLEPARIPIMAGENAALDLWLRPDGFEALALDARGLSWLKVASGQIERSRVKRTSLFRGTRRAGDEAFGIFAMPKARCATDEHKCVRRATGIARLIADATEPPEPRWLAAHPYGRFDRSVRIARAHYDVLARASADGAIELRRFARDPVGLALPAPVASAPEGSAAEGAREPPATPEAQWPIAATSNAIDALLEPEAALPTDDAAKLLLARSEGGRIVAERLDPAAADGTALALGSVAGQTPWLTACKSGARTFVAFGSEREVALVQITPGATPAPAIEELARKELDIDQPLHEEDPARDRVRLVCPNDEAGAALFVLSTRGVLHDYVCAGQHCAWQAVGSLDTPPEQPKQRKVQAFDVARSGEQLVVALSYSDDPTIAVTTLAGREPKTPHQLAGCWEPRAGLCGAPALASDPQSGRIVLAARESGDLRMLASDDGGNRWQAFELQSTHVPLGDPSAPMDQHRKRKGLEK